MQEILLPARKIGGTLTVPPSKSYTQRALAGALLSKGLTTLRRVGNSEDEKAALSILMQAGVRVERVGEDTILLDSKGLPNTPFMVNCGEAGLAARMFTPILAINQAEVIMTGNGSLLIRPMHFFEEILPELQVKFHSNKGYLPFRFEGCLQPKSIEVDGALSSQFITGLCFAFAAQATQPVTLKVKNPTSIPYLLLTLEVMKKFGVEVLFQDNIFYFNYSHQFSPTDIIIESDWSSASFHLVAAALLGELTLIGLNPNSQQADRAILNVLRDFGAKIEWISGDTLKIEKRQQKSFQFDATHCPDLFPPLAVLAAFGNGISVIKGVERLKHKESNRAIALKTELGKLGIDMKLTDNEMIIEANQTISAASHLHSHHDHRIAMACAIAALKADSPSILNDSQAIAKSYPDFYRDLNLIAIR